MTSNSWLFDLAYEDESWFDAPYMWPAYPVESLGGIAIEHTGRQVLDLVAVVRARTAAKSVSQLQPFNLNILRGVPEFSNLALSVSRRPEIANSIIAIQAVYLRDLRAEDIARDVVRFGSLITGPRGARKALANTPGAREMPIVELVTETDTESDFILHLA